MTVLQISCVHNAQINILDSGKYEAKVSFWKSILKEDWSSSHQAGSHQGGVSSGVPLYCHHVRSLVPDGTRIVRVFLWFLFLPQCIWYRPMNHNNHNFAMNSKRSTLSRVINTHKPCKSTSVPGFRFCCCCCRFTGAGGQVLLFIIIIIIIIIVVVVIIIIIINFSSFLFFFSLTQIWNKNDC